MIAVANEAQLRQLRPGDRLNYHGVQWTIDDYSTYSDPQGYETTEWLLKSQTGKQYYLLREFDPKNPASIINWYIAEELRYPTLIDVSTQRDVITSVWKTMQDGDPPYSTLKVFNRVYQFESETRGDYQSEEDVSDRITWDYWDDAHLWNLALEAWQDGSLIVYSSRIVQPEDFTDLQTGGKLSNVQRSLISHRRITPAAESRTVKLILAWFITIFGFLLMVLGV
jgi:hypothetical protein